MASKDLRKRDIWQNISGSLALDAEKAFEMSFKYAFQETNYELIPKPKNFKKIYVDFPLSEETKNEIYNPDIEIKTHGISPDYAIKNKTNNKTLFIEVKRQDGWVEGKPRSAGRGNAHERSCKYFTPGLLKILREESGIQDSSLPFWTVFIGDITRDPCRVREITCWFDTYEEHFFMWRKKNEPKKLVDHFDFHLKHLLD